MYPPHKRIVSLIFSVAMVSGILFFPILSANATTSTFTLNFQTKDLSFEKLKGFDLLSLKEGGFLSSVGEPYLPVKLLQIAIPADLEVRAVRINWEMHQELEGNYNIYPTQEEFPLLDVPWKDQVRQFAEPDPKVYSLTEEHPGKLVDVLGHGHLAGQHIVDLVVHPLQYVPAEGKLVFYTQIEFFLEFGPSTSQPVPVMNRSEKAAAFYNRLVKSFVLNPEDVNFQSITKGKQETAEYLIITDTNFVSALQPLADWKTQKGVPAKIVTLQWIYSTYTGDDEQEQIRNCIIDFYSNHQTIWVLLGGDTNILPHRIAYAFTSNVGNHDWEDDIPCDLYYSDLDGSWNADGDAVYGEYTDNVDLYPDVIVGRAPANSLTDLTKVNTFVSKSLTYQTDPTTDYLTRMLMAAEKLDAGTDGCFLQTYIYGQIVSPYFPDTTLLCESLGNLNKDSFRNALNRGQNIINHDGHGTIAEFSIGPDDWGNSDMDGLTNGSRSGLLYTLACIVNGIDFNCLGEHWINNPDGGGFGFIGNSRYGWYIPGQPTQGSGADLMKEFFEVLIDSNIYHVGKTLSDSKIPFVPYARTYDGRTYRWTLYTLLLLGDPELPLFITHQLAPTPSVFTVTHPDSVDMEPQTVEVLVEVNGSPKMGALVCLWKGDEVYASGYTLLDGRVNLPIDPFAAGDMLVTVTAQNCIPYQGIITIRPVLFIDEFTFDDSVGGNGNGTPEGDETVKLYFTISSEWIPLYGTSVTASVDHPDIVFNDNYSDVGDLLPGGSANNDDDPMEFYVMPDVPQTMVHFTLHIVGNGDDSTRLVKEAWIGRNDILLVDDDQGTGKYPNYEDYYIEALDSAKARYDVWDKKNDPLASFDFSDYDIIIWFTGDHRDSVFSHTDIEGLINCLDNGGRLFLTSQDAVEALFGSPDTLFQHFMTYYLHVGYDGNNTDLLAYGHLGDQIEDSLWIYPGGPDSPDNQTSKDNLVPDSQADTILLYATYGWAPTGLVAGTKFMNDFFKVVVFGFGFEGINSSGSQYYGRYVTKPHVVMQRVLDWLKTRPTINVSYPNGGEAWFVDSTYYIEWESISFDDSVKIKYSADAGTTWSTIVDTTTNDGVYSWMVPDTPSDSCLIRISDVDNGNPFDISDDYFSIINYINVKSPNGGENWMVDSTYDILWHAISTRDSVKIEFSTNGGTTWSTIVDTTTNDGVYSWTVPDTPSDSCMVRISDVGDGIPWDTSDAYFSIIDYIPGDVNGDFVVDIGDVVYLISYLYRGGPPPALMAAGDVNGDCVVDLGDVVYLIAYLYRGGPPPLPGCA